MAYLITYSMSEGHTEIFANCVTKKTPAIWLLDINKEYENSYTRLYFAIEITDEEYNKLDGWI